MPGSSSKSSHKSGHKSSGGSKSGSGPSSSSKSRRRIFDFEVHTNPSSMIQRNQLLNPYLLCSLTAQGVDDLPEVDNMSAVAMLMDMSGEVVEKENCIQNHNVSPQEAPLDTEEGASASGSSDTRYFYFYFDAMTVDPDPGDYYFEISLYDWSSGVDVKKRATATSSSFSVV